MAYLGPPPSQKLATPTSQYFSGNGSATAFTLNRPVNVAEDLNVFVNNVAQQPGSGKSYTATGTTLTFDAAPDAGTNNVYVVYRGLSEGTLRLEGTTTGIDDNADSTAITIDSSERVGIDFVPKTMHANVTSSLNVGSGTVFQRTKDTFLASNTYYNASDAGTSISSGYGLAYYQDVTNGSHQWFTSAASASSADATHSFTIPMTIDSSGRVTIPAQPSFRAVLITSTNTVGNYMVFESVDYNTGNHYNATTGIFTAPVAGRYMVTVQAFNENNISSQLYVRINNVNKSYSLSYAGSNSSGQQYNMMSQHSVFNLAANDTVRVYCNAGEMYVSLATTNSFSCHLLG